MGKGKVRRYFQRPSILLYGRFKMLLCLQYRTNIVVDDVVARYKMQQLAIGRKRFIEPACRL